VATPAARPDTPVEIGRPVQLVRVPEDGVPNAGVTSDGEVANTNAPLPVSSDMTPANCNEVVAANTPRLLPEVVKVPAVGKVTLEAAVVVSVRPKAPTVVRVEPSANAKVAEVAGAVKATLLILVAVATPKTGVTRVGDVANTKSPEPVSSVTADAKLADEGVPKKVATPVAKPDTPVEIGRPVQLVRVPEDGVPNAGVTSDGEVANTNAPLPVSSEITPANCNEVVAANTLRLLPVVVNVPAVGSVTLEAAVVVRVNAKAPAVVRVELLANVKVAAVAGAVTVTLLKLVALRLSEDGTYFNVASDDTATPDPPFTLENKIK
jgi:hypothetical protein